MEAKVAPDDSWQRLGGFERFNDAVVVLGILFRQGVGVTAVAIRQLEP